MVYVLWCLVTSRLVTACSKRRRVYVAFQAQYLLVAGSAAHSQQEYHLRCGHHNSSHSLLSGGWWGYFLYIQGCKFISKGARSCVLVNKEKDLGII